MRFLQVKDLLCSTLRLLNLPGTISYSTQSHCPLECTSQFLQLSKGEDDWIQQSLLHRNFRESGVGGEESHFFGEVKTCTRNASYVTL